MGKEEEFDFDELVKGALPERLITNWVLIAETTDGDHQDLHVVSSPGVTSWLAQGMINCAGDIILTNSYSTYQGETDEEGQQEADD
jgi:hypothetical protein